MAEAWGITSPSSRVTTCRWTEPNTGHVSGAIIILVPSLLHPNPVMQDRS